MFAQTTSGTDFWIALGQIRGHYRPVDLNDVEITIKIVTTTSTNVSMTFTSNPALNVSNISMTSNYVYTKPLNDNEKLAVYTATAPDDVWGATTSKSLHIISNQPISVYVILRSGYIADATNVLPTNTLGKEYYHISYTATGSSYGAERDAMTLVATENNTGYEVHNKYDVLITSGTLSKGQVRYIHSSSDMTGYRVTSTEPLAHFVNHRGAMIPTSLYANADNLFQQMVPVTSWGKEFLVPSINLSGQLQNGLRIRVVASQDGTTITKHQGATIKSGSTSLNRGEYMELEITDANQGCYITSNNPVGVCSYLLSYSELHYNPNHSSNPNPGGPAITWIPSIEQMRQTTAVAPFIPNAGTLSETYAQHYALIITSKNTKDQTTLNSNPLNIYWTTQSEYAYTQYPLSDVNTVYTFSNPSGLSVLLAGFGLNESYYFLAGASMNNLKMEFKVNGIDYRQIAGTHLCSGAVALAATVEYAQNPLNLRWYIDNVEQILQQNQLSWNANLTQGSHTIRMDVVDMFGVTKSVSTTFTVVGTIVLTGPSEIRVDDEVQFSASTAGTWESGNPSIVTHISGGWMKGSAVGSTNLIFTSAQGGCKVTKPVTVRPKRPTASDTIALLYNDSVNFDIIPANMNSCSPPTFGITTPPIHGNITLNSNNTYTYTPHTDWYGVDKVVYEINCPGNESVKATVYFIVSKPLSLYNVACPDAQIAIGMNNILDVQYYWYSDSTGGSPLWTKDTIVLTKNNTDIQTFYVEAGYKNARFTSPRYKVSVSKSENCGNTDPTGCPVDGQLLSREDFGGNSKSDPRVSQSEFSSGTGYEFLAKDSVYHNQYALVKYVTNNYETWQQKFSDHTHLNDTARGYMFLVDAHDDPRIFYDTIITGLCSNINKMYFSVWVANAIFVGSDPNPVHDPILKFELSNGNNIVGTFVTSKVPRDIKNNIKWRNYGFTFDPKGYDNLRLKIYNNTKGSDGNDFALDDIEIRICVPSVTLGNKLLDTIYVGEQYDFNASYTDDGTFYNPIYGLVYRWEYSPNGIDNWTSKQNGSTPLSTVASTYTIPSAVENDKGFYRFVVSNQSNINNPNSNCRVVSSTIALHVKTSNIANDTIVMQYNDSVTFDPVANDLFPCAKKDIIIDTVANSGLKIGRLKINAADSTFTYIPHHNMYGIDSVEYSVQCNSVTENAKIYFIVLKPLSLYNVACDGAKLDIGMYSIPNVEYYWYDAGGNPSFSNPGDTLTFVKNSQAIEYWYVEARYNGISSPRYKIPVMLSNNCGETDPTGCVFDGQLLFSEDFGGNNTSDPRISKKDSLGTATSYTFAKTDQLNPDQYALVKYVDNRTNNYFWQQKFSDHTHSGDTTRGYMFLVDASTQPKIFYDTTITGLCSSIDTMYFSVWVANVIPTQNGTANDNPILKFELSNSGHIVGTYITSEIPKDVDDTVQWRNYGFKFCNEGYSELKLKIYNNRAGSQGNDFALDDIEIRFCPPPVAINKLFDTVCIGAKHIFEASYTDVGNVFYVPGNNEKLAYRWEYSANGSSWQTIGIDSVVIGSSVSSTYTIDGVTDANAGYYRFTVSGTEAALNTICRVASKTMQLYVAKARTVPDLRIMIEPSSDSHKVYLTSFIDTIDAVEVKWHNLGAGPGFIDDVTGELDAKNFMHKRVYTYKYTVKSLCDSSSAKVYLFTSTDKLPIKNNHEIFVCKDLELSKYVQLTQIIGLDEGNGTWAYPYDPGNAIAKNVTTSSARFGGSKIFNAKKAFDDAGPEYDVPGKAYTKAFKFQYTSTDGTIVTFTIIACMN
jgi:hypothetical protein